MVGITGLMLHKSTNNF